jgi:uncharacterized protein YraI
MMPTMKRKLRLLATLAAIALPAAPSRAEDVFVKQPSVTVRAGKGAVYEEVATVKKGDRLNVIAREGKWLKVKVGPREGYVFETAVSGQPTGGDSGGGLSRLMGAGSGTSAASDTAAGRGLGESLVWARSNNMDPSGLNRMLAARKRVTPQEWEKFTADGKVGPAKPQ